jgi:uncharacterized protein
MPPTENASTFGTDDLRLDSAPLHPTWILEGNPVARNRLLATSTDGSGSTYMWDCTAGRFNWHYGCDETIYVIEGSVLLRDQSGVSRRVSAGESFFFPTGTVFEWTVERYIRKVAFCLSPMPRPIRVARRGYRFLKSILRGAQPGDASTPMSRMD